MDEMTARERSGDLFYGEETTPVKLPIKPHECAKCGGKFIPVYAGQKFCPDCGRKRTEAARKASLEARRNRKAENGLPCFSSTIKWYRPQDKLPEKSQSVLFISNSGASISSCMYSKMHEKFNAADCPDGDANAFDVAYWAEIPEDTQNVMEKTFEEWRKNK